MKKILLFSFALLCFNSVMSLEANIPKKHPVAVKVQGQHHNFGVSANRTSMLCDSITNFQPSDTLVVYTDSIGYVTGQNSYSDLGKADRFTNLNHINGTVSGVILYFAVATSANATDTFSVNVWNETAVRHCPSLHFLHQFLYPVIFMQAFNLIILPEIL